MAELERNAFHRKFAGLIEANQAVASEAKRIADGQDAEELGSAIITNLALLFFDAHWVVFDKCTRPESGTEPKFGDLHAQGQTAAIFLDLTEAEVDSLLSQLCTLWKDILNTLAFADLQLSSLVRPAAKKKRP